MQWFLREPLEHRQRDITLLTHLVDDVKKRMAEGTSPDCLTTQTILEQEKSGMSDLEVAYAVSSPFGAGIETVGGKSLMLGVNHFSSSLIGKLQTAGTLCVFFRKSMPTTPSMTRLADGDT